MGADFYFSCPQALPAVINVNFFKHFQRWGPKFLSMDKAT